MKSTIKEELINACTQYVEDRISKIHAAITDLEEALKLETKCSMGDKYETGRAMLHLEFEKLSAQLEQYEKLKRTVTFLQPSVQPGEVKFGKVVKTSKANYFISIPAGEINLDEKFYAIGGTSPIAGALLGKMDGETVVFNGEEISIHAVF